MNLSLTYKSQNILLAFLILGFLSPASAGAVKAECGSGEKPILELGKDSNANIFETGSSRPYKLCMDEDFDVKISETKPKGYTPVIDITRFHDDLSPQAHGAHVGLNGSYDKAQYKVYLRYSAANKEITDVTDKSSCELDCRFFMSLAKEKNSHGGKILYGAESVYIELSSPEQSDLTADIIYPSSRMLTHLSNEPHLFYRIENLGNEKRNIQLDITGVNTVFQEDGDDSKTLTLNPQEEKKYEMIVRPKSIGSKNLSVIATEQDLNYKLEDSISVKVYGNQTGNSKKVPGIGLPQIFILLLLSGTSYTYLEVLR